MGLTARPAPTDLLRCSTAMTASGKALKERIKCLAMNKRMSKALLGLVLAAALTLGLCTLTGAIAAIPGAVDIGEYYIRLANGQYTWNPDKEGSNGSFAVDKEEWDTTLKDLDVSLVEVSYPTALETKDVMMNISATWASAYGQQFYHLPANHPCRAEKVEVSYVAPFSSIYETVSGGSQIINSTTVSVTLELIPTGDMEKAAERLGGRVSTMTVNNVKSQRVTVSYAATFTRKTNTNGTTTWTCTDLTPRARELTEEEKQPSGNYSPTALPVTVAPKEGWQLSELDSNILAVPDLGWNTNSPEDSRELEIRAAMAFAQEYYALKPGHPYRASEVRILPGSRYYLTIAVKPVGGVEAVEPYFKGACPKGAGELEGFVLLSYSISPKKQVVEAFGEKPVYTITVCPMITLGPAPFDVDALPAMPTNERMRYEYDSRPWPVAPEGTGQEGRENAVRAFASSYANQQYKPYSNSDPGASYFDVKLLDAKLTGWSEGNENQVVSGTMTYAFLPTWGAEAAMAFHPGQCTLGTGDLKGYVIRTIPVFYLRLTENEFWECAGICGAGDGKSETSIWLSERLLDVDPLYAPPAGVTWVTAN